MAAAMNVSQAPLSFLNCGHRFPGNNEEVFGHLFWFKKRELFRAKGRMPTSRPSEQFFFAKLSPKIHAYHTEEGGALNLPSPPLDGSEKNKIGSDFWHF